LAQHLLLELLACPILTKMHINGHHYDRLEYCETILDAKLHDVDELMAYLKGITKFTQNIISKEGEEDNTNIQSSSSLTWKEWIPQD